MDTRAFFTSRWSSEQPAFVKVFKALPDKELAYKPHERSSTAQDLVWQLVEEQRVLSGLIDNGQIDWLVREKPATLDAMIAEYEKVTSDLRKRLESVDEARWTGPGRFMVDGAEAWTSTVDDLFWGFLFDMVHHRGQLSTYIRPMGGKVPSIYGPSADDAGS